MTNHKLPETSSDIKLATRLKAGAAKAEDNPWFTPRVLNRLPEKKRNGAGIMGVLCQLLIVMICAVGWVMVLLHDNTGVLTVADITFAAMLVVLTVAMGCSMLRPLLRE